MKEYLKKFKKIKNGKYAKPKKCKLTYYNDISLEYYNILMCYLNNFINENREYHVEIYKNKSVISILNINNYYTLELDCYYDDFIICDDKLIYCDNKHEREKLLRLYKLKQVLKEM